MPDQIVLRSIPESIQGWLAEGRIDGVSQNRRILDALQDAYERRNVRRTVCLFPQMERELNRADAEQKPLFKFIDLFAGIGGMRLGLESVGGECVFTCERDKYCRKTYKAWYGEQDIAEDITDLKFSDVPDHDVLAAGFPCQPFSLAGVSKKNSLGRNHGFLDEAQGTLFFHLAKVIQHKRPPVILLENVKNLKSHDRGRTWRTVASHLDQLGYEIFSQIIDGADYVPQHRERIFIVGFLRSKFTKVVSDEFRFPEKPAGPQPQLASILEKKPDSKYTLTSKLWQYLQDYAEKHRQKGNGFGYGIANPKGITRTLSARYYKDGSEILLEQKGQTPRRLTPTECQALMGFPSELKIVVSDTQAYKQFGNAVIPTVVSAISRQIVEVMKWQLLRSNKSGCLLK